MGLNPLIPPPEATGIPAPVWLFIVLMNVTLVAHFLLMGYVVAATAVQIFLAARAREGSTEEWMLRRTEGPMPVVLSFTITLGVAPLLFVQVLYHQFFYTANILIAYQWFTIIPAMIVAFYLIYLHWGGRVLGRRIPRSLDVAGRVVIFGCLMFVLLTNTVNALVALYPEKWRAIQAAGGNFLALHEPVLFPRLIHNTLAAWVIGSVWLLALGIRSRRLGRTRQEREGGQAMTRLGTVGVVGGAILQIGVGLWLFMAESATAQQALFGGHVGSILWMVALAAVAGLLLLSVVTGSANQSSLALSGLWAALAIVLVGMFAAREAVRQVHLADHFTLDLWPVNLQISSLILFLVLFVVTLAVVAMIIRWMIIGFRKPTKPDEAPSV